MELIGRKLDSPPEPMVTGLDDHSAGTAVRMIRRARSGADETPLSIVEIITGLNAYRDNTGKKECERPRAALALDNLSSLLEPEIADLPILM